MGHYTAVSVRDDDHIFVLVRRVCRYQRANQNPYTCTSIEEEQKTQWPNEKVQKDKQPSTKRQLRVLPTLTDPIGVCLFSSRNDHFGLVLESTSVSSLNYGHHVRFVFFKSRFYV
jgi:hypothetical protein